MRCVLGLEGRGLAIRTLAMRMWHFADDMTGMLALVLIYLLLILGPIP